MKAALASHENTAHVADYPVVLSQLMFFYNTQTIFRGMFDIVGCHIFALIGWFMFGLIDEIGGGRNNPELLFKQVKVKPYESSLMFVHTSHVL
jgi:hypothetical protein